MDYDLYTDEQIVNGILHGDRSLTEYFFHKKCSRLLAYILYSVFDGQQDCRALESELFLHIAHNDWHKLRQFEYRSSLLAYVSVIAVRFFQKKTRYDDRFPTWRCTIRETPSDDEHQFLR